MSKGGPSQGKKSSGKSHIMCRRCGNRSMHARHNVCASCGFGKIAKRRKPSWVKKNHQA